jgi:hypothetical protein
MPGRAARARDEAVLLGVLFGLAAFPVAPARAADFALTRRGVPTGAIVTAAAPSADEKLAASELQAYLRKISGASLPVVTAAGRSALVPSVRIGIVGKEPVKDWTGDAPPRDGFALETRGNVLYVVGGDARGALYGVYELLEGSFGVRWFMPTDLGEDVPSQASLSLPLLKQRGAPAFPHVSGLIWAGGPGAAAWELRMRARVGPSVSFGHNWSNILPATAANRAANPELFAEVNGERGTSSQLCSAHPEVVRLSVEAARRYFDRSPAAPLFSISPNDGYGFCEDSRCRAVDALYGVNDGSISDRLVHYANEVLAELEKTHPDRQLGILAYVTHTAPPQRARPHPGYATLVTHTPWEFCHVHAIDDPACPSNRRYAAYLRGWAQLTRHAGVYDYYGHFFAFTPWPIIHSIRKDVPFFKQLGIERFTSETQQNWANQGLNFYVAARLAWNPELDVDRLLADYHARFYGKAAEPMRCYWERWEEAMLATAAAGDGGYEWLRMFTPELVEDCGRLLTEAERLAAGDADKYARRVAFARSGFRFTEAFAEMLDAGLRGDSAGVSAAGEEAIRRINATAGSQPQAFFIGLAVPQTRTLMTILSSGRAPWLALR